MGSYILCQTKLAEVPYYIENISTNIYSLDELCYYLYHNLYLADESILNEELCRWIEDELDLPLLAGKVSQAIRQNMGLQDIIYPIFKEINYLSYEELRIYSIQLTDLQSEESVFVEKKRADLLVENRMYVMAIRIYQQILFENKTMDEEFQENIYHNLGCAYSYLFQMEEALECFWKAYEVQKSHEALVTYLLAYKSMRNTLAYSIRIETLKVPQEIRDEVDKLAAEFDQLPEEQVAEEELDDRLKEYIKEYHRSTGA